MLYWAIYSNCMYKTLSFVLASFEASGSHLREEVNNLRDNRQKLALPHQTIRGFLEERNDLFKGLQLPEFRSW